MSRRSPVTVRIPGGNFCRIPNMSDAGVKRIPRENRIRYRWIILAILICSEMAHPAVAESPTREFWPEIDVWLRVSSDWRFSMFVPLSRNIETAYREGNLILQADYAFGHAKRPFHTRMLDENRNQSMKTWLARGGYLGAKSLNDKGDAYREYMAFGELHLRTPIKGRWLVSHRLRPELRWIGDEHEFSTRFRYRFMVEKELQAGPFSFVPYANVEPYYDSRYSTFNRVRLIGGTSVAWSPRYALECNFTYQHDSRSSVTNLYALGIILHLFFEAPGRRREAGAN
jgi:hypothetical protein